MIRVLTRSFGLAAVLAAGATAAGAATAVLNPASPTNYLGQCPGTIKFTGWITSGKPGPVKYQWFRSDGAKGPVQSLWFRPGGARAPISDTWTLGGPGLPTFSGWEAVHVIFPAGPDSNKATFTLRCAQRAAPPPRRP